MAQIAVGPSAQAWSLCPGVALQVQKQGAMAQLIAQHGNTNRMNVEHPTQLYVHSVDRANTMIFTPPVSLQAATEMPIDEWTA
jgi:aspartate aminotransferase-like enzyme